MTGPTRIDIGEIVLEGFDGVVPAGLEAAVRAALAERMAAAPVGLPSGRHDVGELVYTLREQPHQPEAFATALATAVHADLARPPRR